MFFYLKPRLMEVSTETRMQQMTGRRLVVFPLPLQGHINPMLQLANILHSRGFNITVIHTQYNSLNPSKYPHFTFRPISDGLLETPPSTERGRDLLTLLNVNCVAPFRDCLAQLLSSVSEEPIACLITDAIWHFTQAVADGLKLPRLVLHSGNISFLAFAVHPFLRETGFLPKQDSQTEEPVEALPPLKIKDFPTMDIANPEDDLYMLIDGMVKANKGSSGFIWNSFKELEQPALATLRRRSIVPLFPIGPFHKYFPASSSSLLAQDPSSISWLDTQSPKSVIYVSFGSLATFDETEFLEMAWGLANSMQPFLWVVRPGLIPGSEWLEPLRNGFLEAVSGRGHIVKWAPQQEVLAHPATGGFWTHSGWNSTLESICEGVPMICSPRSNNQMVSARYASDVWRVGVQLENGLERVDVERAIRKLMVESEGEEMRERIMCLKEKADLCLREGGSSYQSLESLVNYIFSF
ncbi:UDP-glycosyltransferase 76B1-like isoform X1 [Cornus florida]|uniref:UDP-glycosyltransferase 76B1-like isoform X1 n=1 Tax=Cornus florida TaxID=4283 RepID=UPI0028989DFF|nr:UDP-glycosyltransferase 76B1-like isoform X1 [Cornus florida]